MRTAIGFTAVALALVLAANGMAVAGQGAVADIVAIKLPDGTSVAR